jgi:Na+-translocating ferredoxin:NAD+ oxidoreductase RnfD subunit
MKFTLQLILTIIICFVLQSFLPWWTLAIGSFAVAYFSGNKSYLSFAAGFLGVAILWLGMAYYIDSSTHSILTEKVNKLLPLNSFLLTALIGGLIGGFSALTGAFAKTK